MQSIDIRSYPVQVQSSMITEEVRMALFLSPGNLLHFFTSETPLIQNKHLLIDVPIDYSKAEEYLKLGFAMNEQYQMDPNLKNLLVIMLPNLSQVISLRTESITASLTPPPHSAIHPAEQPLRIRSRHHRGDPPDQREHDHL